MTSDEARHKAKEILSDLGDAADLGLSEDQASGRVEVAPSGRNPVDVCHEVVDVVVGDNDPPHLFRMGDAVVRVQDDGSLEPYDNDRWLLHVCELIDFISLKGDDDNPDKPPAKKIIDPPKCPLRMAPKAAISRLPVLDGIVHAPYLDADGHLISADGYDARSRLVLRSSVTLPAIPTQPSSSDLAQAVKLLTEELLGDFPFTAERDRANLLALLLTLTGRAFFGLAPLFVVDASTAGSGKGLLVQTVGLIATGAAPHLMELPADGEEQRKKVTTALLAGNDLLAWDEAHVIAGKSLAMILTAETYSDRLLGSNKMLTMRNRFTQVALGNNVQVWGDMKRRVVPVRLEPDCEHPEHRGDFRHPDLPGWVREHRGELLGAALTIWRAWIAAGRPKANVTMGSFERWAGAVGGALANAGIIGFMDDTAEWLDFSDPDDEGWTEHLTRLREIFGDNSFTVKDVIDKMLQTDIKLPHYKHDPSKSMPRVIGNMYRHARGKWWGRYRLEPSSARSSETGGRTWSVLMREGDARDRGNTLSRLSRLSAAGQSVVGTDSAAKQPPDSRFQTQLSQSYFGGQSQWPPDASPQVSAVRTPKTESTESTESDFPAFASPLDAPGAAGLTEGAELAAYVVDSAARLTGEILPVPDAEKILAGFIDRFGHDDAWRVARAAFDVHGGMWAGTCISPKRFAASNDGFFAKPILAQLDGKDDSQ